MNLRWTRLLALLLTALLLLAAAGPAAQIAWATEDAPPQEVLTPSWSWLSNQQGALAGNSVGGAGDVNGDGYDDVIMGAPRYYTTDEDYKFGAAFVFYGGPGGLVDYDSWMVLGEVKGKLFGWSVAGAGDVNCDGYDDVIIGSPAYGQEHGKVYVYYGSKDGLSRFPDWTYTGQQPQTNMGWSVASAGNVNADTYEGRICEDVIVGANLYSDGQLMEGGAFLFLGSPGGLSEEPVWTGTVNAAGAQFGYAVSGVGDLNQDGYDDVLIGAPFCEDSSEQNNEGAIFLYYGTGTGLTPVPMWFTGGELEGAKLGWSVAGAGDVNNDGFPDIAAGAPGWIDPLGLRGAVFVYHGSTTWPKDVPDWSQVGEQTVSSGYGVAVAGAGDVNGDGIDDLIIGAKDYSANSNEANGAIYVHHGGPGGLAEHAGWRAEGAKSDTDFGASVAAAGDINRDGYNDILVGAPEYKDASENKRGGAFVYHGFLQEVVDGEIQPRMHYLFLPITTH